MNQNQINRINGLHEEAMDISDEGDRAKKRGDLEEAREFYRRALVLETQAADEIPFGTEPSRAILYRSAATLALLCHLEPEAERLANLGLAGTPPAFVVVELREVIEQARKHEPQK